MAFNGSGLFVRLYNWVNDAANSINIKADRMDAEMDGFAQGLSNCITRDGQGKPSATIDWNGQNLQNVNALSSASASVSGTTSLSGAVNFGATFSLASASTVNIGGAAAYSGTITGTTTITAFDTVAAGIIREVTFSGALTLTHNAVSLILPGATNIATQAGDCATFLSLGSGNWRCTKYVAATAAPRWPAFSASLASAQAVSTGVATKLQLGQKDYDTASCYDNTTNYRFTPNVAGYYTFKGAYYLNATTGQCQVRLYKNGALSKSGSYSNGGTDGALSMICVDLFMNGTTDYVELYGYQNSGGTVTGGAASLTYFTGVLSRPA